MFFNKDEIIFLLGAGASFDAKIPISDEMIKKVERLILTDQKWKEYKNLYYLVKSAIIYADGVQGKFDKQVNFNIERLFNVLIELEKKEEHPLYPFIGNWNVKFSEIVGNNFELIKEFQDIILEELKGWMNFTKRNANYFKNLYLFREEYTYSLRIFTLNYDLCIEQVLSDKKIERGFNEYDIWDYRIYTEKPEEDPNDIYLYKLHGSIDWERNKKTGEITCNVGIIKTPDLIFGNIYKLQYIDPYLFQFYELRRFTLKSKLIIIIGYGFGDNHINGILSQALKQALMNKEKRKLLIISPGINKNYILNQLKSDDVEQISEDQIEVINKKAKEFLESELNLHKLESLFPDEDLYIF